MNHISNAYRRTFFSVSNDIHLFGYHDRRCYTVSDLPWVLFHVILWISDRVTTHSRHHHTCLPIHRTLSLSHCHKLWACLAISTSEIWDICNYRTIYSNQPDPNLYFPEAPARLLASSYLPGRHSPRMCFLIRPWLKLFQQRGKRQSSCVSGFFEGERFQNINTDRLLIQTLHSVVSQLGVFFFFLITVSWHITVQLFHLDFVVWVFKPLASYGALWYYTALMAQQGISRTEI